MRTAIQEGETHLMRLWERSLSVGRSASLECSALLPFFPAGCTFFDAAELYNVGLEKDNNEQLLGEHSPKGSRVHLTICHHRGGA